MNASGFLIFACAIASSTSCLCASLLWQSTQSQSIQYVPEVKHSQYNLMHLLFLHLHLFFVVAVVVADVVVAAVAVEDDFCIDDDDDDVVFVVFDVIDNGKCGGCGGGPAWNDCVFTVVVDKLVLSDVFSFENV